MKITDIIVESVVAEKQRTQAQRSDEKCWPGKHKEGTKPSPTHPGIRVNNCVPNESIEEGKVANARVNEIRQLAKDFFGENPYSSAVIAGGKFLRLSFPVSSFLFQPKGIKHYRYEPMSSITPEDQQAIKGLVGRFQKFMSKHGVGTDEFDMKFHIGAYLYASVRIAIPQEQPIEETEAWDKPGYDLIVMDYYNSGNTPSEIAQQLGIDEEEVEYIIYKHENGLAEAGSLAQQAAIAINMKKHHQKPKHTDEDAEAQFDRIEEMVGQLAEQYGVDSEAVWDLLEDHTDEDLLTETAAWHRKAGKNKNGGLNRKGVMSYRREHPGSKLQTAVTTKPSKLKPGSKAAKRRKSFCARMSGVKGPMKKPNGKPTRKALALRKWNC